MEHTIAVARLIPLLLVVLVLGSACSERAKSPDASLAPGESRTFKGTLSASGSRHTLRLGPEHKASIVSLSGSLLLTGQRGLGVGFRAEVIALSDSRSGGQGRCVWTDERGDQVFSDIAGAPVGTGGAIVGTITGGTGRYAGLTGEYRFHWEYVIDTEEGAISGRTVDIEGRVQAAAGGPAGKTAAKTVNR
jgi:hypothetical protein